MDFEENIFYDLKRLSGRIFISDCGIQGVPKMQYTCVSDLTQIKEGSTYKLNFDLGKKNEIHHHSWKGQLKISKIAKFGREML